MSQRIKFKYRNHRGDINERDVSVHYIGYLPDPGYGYEPGWFLIGWDHSRSAQRTFKFENIIPASNVDETVLVDLRAPMRDD